MPLFFPFTLPAAAVIELDSSVLRLLPLPVPVPVELVTSATAVETETLAKNVVERMTLKESFMLWLWLLL